VGPKVEAGSNFAAGNTNIATVPTIVHDAVDYSRFW